jgi:hypothetical protein
VRWLPKIAFVSAGDPGFQRKAVGVELHLHGLPKVVAVIAVHGEANGAGEHSFITPK